MNCAKRPETRLLIDSDEGLSLLDQVSRFLDLVEKPRCMPPTDDECFMAMAYAVGQRSSCIKRKVGALIVDARRASILSSGYNEIRLFRGGVADA